VNRKSILYIYYQFVANNHLYMKNNGEIKVFMIWQD